MNTCETCKFWGDVVLKKSSMNQFERRECRHPLHSDELTDHPAAFGECHGIAAEGGVFATAPKFGCIHHESK